MRISATPSTVPSSPASHSPQNTIPTVTPDDIRRKLEKVLADKKSITRSATVSFVQFDADQSGSLDLEETKQLLDKLCENLQLPPIDEKTLKKVIARYGDGSLQLGQFVNLYWDLLLRIRDKYYPTKTMKVRRSFFVSRKELAEGQEIRENIRFEKTLGSGSFGQVHLVTDVRSGSKRVCKTINKEQAKMPVEQIEAEIEFLKSLDHPQIIKIFDVYEDYNNIYIIMERCEGGELMSRVVHAQKAGLHLNERYVSMLMKQILEAIAYCHDQRIVHKDLKPENVMFGTKDGDCIKIIDFGVAEVFKKCGERSRNAAGTALYMAPEVYQRNFGLKCDVWSAGCILYLLLTGKLPFTGHSISELQKKVCTVEPKFSQDCRHLSSLAVDILQKMLTKDVRRRPRAAECLQHAWFLRVQENKATALPPDLCDNLQKYMRQSGLKNALVNLMAHQLDISGSQIREIIKIFRALDKDGNGTLTYDEISEGLASAGWPKWDINRVLQALDIDDSGGVQYTEFLSACYCWRETELDVIWTAFRKLDDDGDGKISVSEFCKALGGGESKLLSNEDMQTMMEQIDKNNDGVVEWDEFVEYMRS